MPKRVSKQGEYAHRFERNAGDISGEVISLFPFSFKGEKYQRNWLRGVIGVEGELIGGKASLMVNGTTKGSAPSTWVSASWQKAF